MYIGRDITNDIVINDAEVSRRHVRLTYESGRYVIEDLGSTNGTFVNGQRLMGPHVLGVGEVIMVGENVMLLFTSTQFDPGATVIGSSAQAGAPPLQAPPPRQEYAPPPASAYTGQVPPGPEEYPMPPAGPKKREMNSWVLAGCGCLFLLAIVCVVAAFVIDYLQMWCQLFGFIIPGC
jgi:hypothetical protein